MNRQSRSVFLKRVFASFLRATKKEGRHGSGAKQLSITEEGVYAMQPEGAWRNAAQLCEQKHSVVAASFLRETCNLKRPRDNSDNHPWL
jgi:hypothetical protein